MDFKNKSNSMDVFGVLLTHAERSMKSLLINELNNEGIDITGAQYRILGLLCKEDGMRQKDFLKFTKRSKVAIVHLIDALEEQNLVTRIPDMADQRSKRVYLTPKGKKIGETLVRIGDEIDRKALNDIQSEEIEVAERVLKKIIDNIKG
jgi:DNA-binding MarR family transcriptional regulator